MNKFILVAAFISMVYASPLDWRIVGGSIAKEGQFPYQVAFKQDGDLQVCGGSIINEEWILTAAHCITGMNLDILTVVVGTTKLNNGGQIYKIARAIAHSGFNFTHLHDDIALVKLSKKLTFGSKVQPIALETTHVGVGEDLVVSGWGATSYPGDFPKYLQYLSVVSISSEDCHQRHVNITGIAVDGTQLCTLTKSGEGACQGDSGGPLAHNNKVAGIVSWGQPCAVGAPDVFTRVSSYINWINDNMK